MLYFVADAQYKRVAHQQYNVSCIRNRLGAFLRKTGNGVCMQ